MFAEGRGRCLERKDSEEGHKEKSTDALQKGRSKYLIKHALLHFHFFGRITAALVVVCEVMAACHWNPHEELVFKPSILINLFTFKSIKEWGEDYGEMRKGPRNGE